jgi:hypothetical protein
VITHPRQVGQSPLITGSWDTAAARLYGLMVTVTVPYTHVVRPAAAWLCGWLAYPASACVIRQRRVYGV